MNAKRAKRIRRVARRALAMTTGIDDMNVAWRKACDELEPNMKMRAGDTKKVMSAVRRELKRGGRG